MLTPTSHNHWTCPLSLCNGQYGGILRLLSTFCTQPFIVNPPHDDRHHHDHRPCYWLTTDADNDMPPKNVVSLLKLFFQTLILSEKSTYFLVKLNIFINLFNSDLSTVANSCDITRLRSITEEPHLNLSLCTTYLTELFDWFPRSQVNSGIVSLSFSYYLFLTSQF